MFYLGKKIKKYLKYFPVRRSSFLLFFTLLLTSISCSSCVVGYVARAGYEEAKILIKRKPLSTLIADERTDPVLREKFSLVLEARDFAKEIGLKPKGSFSDYSKIKNEDLLWVINACPVDSLTPKTWWFPIVGTIPYRGYFNKEQALEVENDLKNDNYDTFLRSSSAFSTLGWFDDPLLSTTAKHDKVILIDTVIHEILHNTIWIKNHVAFNESLANFVGAKGVFEFYQKKNDTLALENAKKTWQRELEYAKFLDNLASELKALYQSSKTEKLPLEILKEKKAQIIKENIELWKSQNPTLNITKKDGFTLNNATIMAQQIYLTKIWIFQELYDLNGSSLKSFIEITKQLAKKINTENKPPYEIFEDYILCQKDHQSNSNATADNCL